MACLQLPKVSIGLPVYNGGKYLAIALDSLLRQTYSDFELIISDNASDDNTELICRKYMEKDERIKYIRQVKNTGCYRNTQVVLDMAQGEYFMWASHDDIWQENWLSTLLPIAIKYQCLATGVYVPIDENGKEISHPASRRELNYFGARLIRRMKFYVEPGLLGKGCPFFGLMPTSVIKEIGVSWLEYEPVGGDAVYIYVILGKMEVRCNKNTILYKRNHSESLGEFIVPQVMHKSYWPKIYYLIESLIRSPIPKQYIVKSNVFESGLIYILYILALMWVFYQVVDLKITNIIMGRLGR